MPFDKSRHLCLQAFPTSILNGGSLSAPAPRHSARLTVTYSTLLTASGFNHAHSGTPTDTMESTEALCIRKNEKTQVQVAQKASPSHMWSTKMIFSFSFLCNSQTVLSRCCSAREPPVESTHRHRGAARCPRC